MELSFPEYSKSSSEETDRSSYQNYDTVTGRSYECVFCKRGFTTAQALGGHMNIHRKDRAKTKPNFPPSSSSKVIDDNYADLGFYSAIRSPPQGNYYSTSSEVNANYYQIFFPSLKPSYTYYSEVFCEQNPRDRGLFGQDWKRSLSLHGNPLSLCENEGKEADSGEEDGLDLELRLGYDP